MGLAIATKGAAAETEFFHTKPIFPAESKLGLLAEPIWRRHKGWRGAIRAARGEGARAFGKRWTAACVRSTERSSRPRRIAAHHLSSVHFLFHGFDIGAFDQLDRRDRVIS